MSRRTNSRNAFESGLASGAAATGDITVDSAIGLVAPLYLVIDPDDLNLREYVKATAVDLGTGLLSVSGDRGLTGSAGGAGQVHAQGAKVRTVAVQQWLEDIFADIEDLEQTDLDHIAAADPHSQYLTPVEGDARYVELAGDTMTGPLVLSADPVANLGAATKQSSEAYADSRDHDHDTPIAVHAAIPNQHHTKYSDGDAVSALAANGPILKQVVKWGDSMTLTGQGDNNQITYDISSFGFTGVDNLIATVRHGAANQQSRESIMTIEGFNINQLTVNGYGAGTFVSGGAFFVVQIEEYDRNVLVTAPPVIP